MSILELLRISILRSLYFSLRFRGQIVLFRGTRIRLESGARIRVAPGGRLVLGRHLSGSECSVLICRNGCLDIGGKVSVSRGTRIWVGGDATVEIGDGTFIHVDSSIMCWERVTIGAHCAISWNVNILDGNQHDLIIRGTSWPKTTPVEVGDNVWIGTGVTLVGASIGDGAVVGACSLVTAIVPDKALATGNPAQVVAKDIAWVF